jgi:hypothetical protein
MKGLAPMARLSDYTDDLIAFKRQRSFARAVVALARDESLSGSQRIVREHFGGDRQALDIIEKGAVVPASTSGVTQFNQTNISTVISLLGPTSASAAIFRSALGVGVDHAYGVMIPTLTASGTGVNFIAQGAPIPVKQFAFSGPTLVPQKIALVLGFTRELFNSSSADVLVRALLTENFALGLDSILLDAVAGDTTRPAGLRNSVAATTATAGGGLAAMTADLAALAAAVAPIGGTELLFVASPKQYVKINLLRTSPLPFPVIASSGLADGIVVCIATNALAVAGGNDPPRIQVSTEALLHFEDTTPLAIGTVGTPPTVAAPTRSLYQTDGVALRLTADITWAMRATGGISWTQSVSW